MPLMLTNFNVTENYKLGLEVSEILTSLRKTISSGCASIRKITDDEYLKDSTKVDTYDIVSGQSFSSSSTDGGILQSIPYSSHVYSTFSVP